MALNFPASPADGQTYTVGGKVYVYSAVYNAWKKTSSGEAGPQGETGPQGIQGTAGIQGERGLQGEIGPEGVQGALGLQGSEGAQGQTGLQGFVGLQGELGTQGATGAQGLVGAQGQVGAQGEIGTQGEQGLQGLVGSQGTTGPVGTQGVQGVLGIQGVSGTSVSILGEYANLAALQAAQPTGSSGDAYLTENGDLYVWSANTSSWTNVGNIEGPVGAQGAVGAQGVQGVVGLQGLVGAQGSTGAQGLIGLQGTTGSQGISGIQGATGAQGTVGEQGLQGTTGAQGATGTQGTSGINGTQGATGATGPVAGSANQVVYKDGTNTPTGSANMTFDGTNISVAGSIRSTASSGDEGGELFLNKSATNTTIDGGVTIDVYQNRLRIFEQGGSSRGYYLDLTSGVSGVGTPLFGGVVANAQSANYTLALTDIGEVIEMGSGSALTLTVPADATVNFPIGTKIDVLRTGAGEVSIAGATSPNTVTVNSEGNKLRINAQWQAATLIKRAANTWVLIGALKA